MKGGVVTNKSETFIQENTISEDLKESDLKKKTTRGRKTFRTITNEHVYQAMTYYLRTLRSINQDEEVTHMFKVPEGWEIKIGVFND